MVGKQRKETRFIHVENPFLPGFQYIAVLSNEIGHSSRSPCVFRYCETAVREVL